jgi:calcineurin-like phosphoesterase family protein
MNIFFTSDEHYGHSNIIKFCDRPFTDTDEMRETLIRNHNEVVPAGNASLTIHLGDIFWNKVSLDEAESILKRLNGKHALIYGNHDKIAKRLQENGAIFTFAREVHEFNSGSTPMIFLSHYAHRVWPASYKGSYHLYGHSHGKIPDQGLSMDVGVDCTGFRPISLAAVDRIMKSRITMGGV